jgi:SAM-dependent methyltransferase
MLPDRYTSEMETATFAELLSPTGRAALAVAAGLDLTEAKYPACFDRLCKQFSPELARAALDTVLLREKARVKFARAEAMFFTRESLEMATSEAVARYRAARFAPFATVADLGCGIGGDAIALAAAGCGVVAMDHDAQRLRMAEANLAAYGLSGRFIAGDARTIELPPVDAAFADPGRRPGGRRTLSVHDCEPPVPELVARFPRGFPLGVKIAPGVPRDELAGFDANAEFISLSGELKECVLWFGPLRRGRVQVTVLPGPHILSGDPNIFAEVGPVGAYLYDPDPAITRAGLVGELGRQLAARQIDPAIAFLTADHLTPTPFASAYRVEEVLPFHAKRVGEWLRARGIGRVTIVKRGSAADAEELTRRWKLRGAEHRAVILTRAVGASIAIIGERV